jgi:hypothetical protein
MRLAATSTEFVHVAVTPPAGVDLTGTTPRLAFLPVHTRTNPAAEDYHDGEWVDGEALVLIGPDGGALTLTEGDYWVWIAFDPPGSENIATKSGLLSII